MYNYNCLKELTSLNKNTHVQKLWLRNLMALCLWLVALTTYTCYYLPLNAWKVIHDYVQKPFVHGLITVIGILPPHLVILLIQSHLTHWCCVLSNLDTDHTLLHKTDHCTLYVHTGLFISVSIYYVVYYCNSVTISLAAGSVPTSWCVQDCTVTMVNQYILAEIQAGTLLYTSIK